MGASRSPASKRGRSYRIMGILMTSTMIRRLLLSKKKVNIFAILARKSMKGMFFPSMRLAMTQRVATLQQFTFRQISQISRMRRTSTSL